MRGTFGGAKDAPFGRGLRDAAETAAAEVLGITARDRVLVITNPDAEMAPVAWALHDAAAGRGAETVLVSSPAKGASDMADPTVLRALETDPDVIAVLSTGMLGSDPERIHRPIHGTYTHYLQYLVGAGRSRAFWAPGITKRWFVKAMMADPAALATECEDLRAQMADAVELHVRATNGTNLVMPVQGDKAGAETGRYLEPGQGGALPAGEVLIPALEGGTASGIVVFDGTVALADGGAMQPKKGLTVRVEEGMVTEVVGDDVGQAMRESLAEGTRLAERAVAGGWLTRDQAKVYGANSRRLAELGIGLNAGTKTAGVMGVDQTQRGIVRLGFGAARHEMPPGAPIALHGLVRKADVTAILEDGTELPLVSGGRFLAPERVVARRA